MIVSETYPKAKGDMADFYEIDFLKVETKKSGDAITIRYSVNGVVGIHVVDGGYIDTGTQIVDHIRLHYGGATHVDNVVLTHPDQDHANGLRAVLEQCTVGTLWMNRPWLYVDQLLPRFPSYSSRDALARKLKELYAASAELESIAHMRGIPIREAFQGSQIGPFHIMAPSMSRYLDCVAQSDKTPETLKEAAAQDSTLERILGIAKKVVALIKSVWGDEYFPPGPTSAENEMSVVQYGSLNGREILLTGDAGREALQEVIDYAPYVGVAFPGIDLFQVPHHGGRHNVSTEILDRLLGERLSAPPESTHWNAICSSAAADEDHPRKSVVRAMMHRGGKFAATEGRTICFSKGIAREGWNTVTPTPYPLEQEGD
jgi:hypothetical protein